MHLDEILRIANPKQLAAIKHPLAPLMIILVQEQEKHSL